MTIINVVEIDGVEMQIETLPNKEQLAYHLNKDALVKINYYEEETA